LTARAPRPLREVAVIYRFNAQSLPIQLELIAHDIPYYCRKEDNLSGQKVLGGFSACSGTWRPCASALPRRWTDFVTSVTAFYPRLDDSPATAARAALRRARARPYFDALDPSKGAASASPACTRSAASCSS
jgi:hypothetical protein